MARVLVIGGFAPSLLLFRGELLRRMASQGHEVTACAAEDDDRVRKALAGFGVRYVPVSLERTGLNPFRDANTVWSLARVIRETRPEVMLAYTVKPVIYAGFLARIHGIKRAYALITGLGYAFSNSDVRSRLVGQVVRGLYRGAMRGYRKVFFQNPENRELFLQERLILERDDAVLTAGSGVDLNHFGVRPLPVDVSFLLIARLLRDKGVREYVEAARIVKSRYPECKFRLVGWIDGNPAAIGAEELQSWVRDGTIEYLGRLDDVREAIEKASVYVLPSYHEGLPRTVVEAMGMGRPIITTDVPGCRETVVAGENGLLVPPRDAEGLARAMEYFVLRPEEIRRMGNASRAMAVAKFDVHEINEQMLRVMELLT